MTADHVYVRARPERGYLDKATRRHRGALARCFEGAAPESGREGITVEAEARIDAEGRVVGPVQVAGELEPVDPRVTACVASTLERVRVPLDYPRVGGSSPSVSWDITALENPPPSDPIEGVPAEPVPLAAWLASVGWTAPAAPGPDAWVPVVASTGASRPGPKRAPMGAPLTLSTTAGPAPLTVEVAGPSELVAKGAGTHQMWGGCGFQIDWGDGTPMGQPDCGPNLTHTYAFPGTYEVSATRYHLGPTDGQEEDWRGSSQVTVEGSAPAIDRISALVVDSDVAAHGQPLEVRFVAELTAPSRVQIAVVDELERPLARFAWDLTGPGPTGIRFAVRGTIEDPMFGTATGSVLLQENGLQIERAVADVPVPVAQRRAAWDAAALRPGATAELRVWLERDDARVGSSATLPLKLDPATIPSQNLRFGVFELSPGVGFVEAATVTELGCRSFFLDWGDGTTEAVHPESCDKVGPLLHTYATPGAYRVDLRGDRQPQVSLSRTLHIDGEGE